MAIVEEKNSVSFGDITEVLVCIFMAEIFSNVDYEDKKLNSSFGKETSFEYIINGLKKNQYPFGRTITLSKSGADVEVTLRIDTTAPATEFFNSFRRSFGDLSSDNKKKFNDILGALSQHSFRNYRSNIFVSKSAPFDKINSIIATASDMVVSGLYSSVDIAVSGIGTKSKSRGQASVDEPEVPPAPKKLTNKFEFVPKCDVEIKLSGKKKKENKAATISTERLSVKGDSVKVESPGISTAIQMLYKISKSNPLFAKWFRPSLSINDKEQFKKEFMNAIKTKGKIPCSIDNTFSMLSGLIRGDKDAASVYFKVFVGESRTAIRTIKQSRLYELKNSAKSCFVERNGENINIKIINKQNEEHTLFKLYLSKDLTVAVNIPAHLLTEI